LVNARLFALAYKAQNVRAQSQDTRFNQDRNRTSGTGRDALMRTVKFLALSAYAKTRQAVTLTTRIATIASVLLSPFAATAEPTTLKLSFFTSDQSATYLSAVKPFVDAVNLDSADLLRIEVFLSGTLGKTQKELPELVRSGVADIAFACPKTLKP
jgi:hypothetical protein